MLNEKTQHDDKRIIDYQLWPLPGTKLMVRGPNRSSLPTRYFVALGAEQTFGRFAKEPYPSLLESTLGIPAINLGFLGAGPSFFFLDPELLQIVNGAEFVIVQMMSGSAVSNSVFELGLNQGTLRKRNLTDEPSFERPFRSAGSEYQNLIDMHDTEVLIRVRAETRDNYAREMIELLRRIEPPKTLLYWSTRPPRHKDDTAQIGAFPHFVNTEVVARIKPYADHYVESVTSRGLPQPLFDSETGAPVTLWNKDLFPHVKLRNHNHKYPSPEMHADVATALLSDPDRLRRKVSPNEARLRPVIVHMHIFKNAGSSVDAGLKQRFGPRWNAWDLKKIGETSSREDLLRFLHENKQFEAVSSHQLRAPIYGDEKFQFFPIVFLRHPVDRIASIYHYERKLKRAETSQSLTTAKSNELDFKGFVTWVLSRRISSVNNFQTLALSRAHMLRNKEQRTVVVSSQDLFDANIFLSSLPVVGVVDQFDKSAKAFEKWLAPIFLWIKIPSREVNRSRPKGRALPDKLQDIEVELGKPLYEQLLQANQYDLELYQIAVRKLAAIS